MFDVIDKSTLKPGDVVGIRMKTQIGWGFFRTNGAELGRNAVFYPITAETNHRTHVAKCAEKISSSLMALERLQRDGKLFSQDDDFIVKCAERLEQILHEVV